jgi:hypothetical protein
MWSTPRALPLAITALVSGCYLSHTRHEPADAGPPPEGGFRDTGPPLPHSGVVEFQRASTHYLVTAYFSDAPLEELAARCPAVRTIGACRSLRCPGPTIAADPGTVDVVYRDTTILHGVFDGVFYSDFAGDSDGDGVVDTPTPLLPLPDGVLTMRGTGGSDVPAFAQTIAIPTVVHLAPIRPVARAEGMSLTWTPGEGEEMEIQIEPDDRLSIHAALCDAPMDEGHLDVAPEILDELEASAGFVVFGVARNTAHVAAGDYAIEIRADSVTVQLVPRR